MVPKESEISQSIRETPIPNEIEDYCRKDDDEVDDEEDGEPDYVEEESDMVRCGSSEDS